MLSGQAEEGMPGEDLLGLVLFLRLLQDAATGQPCRCMLHVA